MSTTPSEPPAGQDVPPDVRTAVRALVVLLADVLNHLERGGDAADLRLRVAAHRRALVRLRETL